MAPYIELRCIYVEMQSLNFGHRLGMKERGRDKICGRCLAT